MNTPKHNLISSYLLTDNNVFRETNNQINEQIHYLVLFLAFINNTYSICKNIFTFGWTQLHVRTVDLLSYFHVTNAFKQSNKWNYRNRWVVIQQTLDITCQLNDSKVPLAQNDIKLNSMCVLWWFLHRKLDSCWKISRIYGSLWSLREIWKWMNE